MYSTPYACISNLFWLSDHCACKSCIYVPKLDKSSMILYLGWSDDVIIFLQCVWKYGLRYIKDWMNTKNTFHIISLERKMIWVVDVISDHFSTGLTYCPTQSHAYMLYFRLSLPCVPRFSVGVAELQKERTCKRYIDERTTAHAAMNGRSEDWQCNNME